MKLAILLLSTLPLQAQFTTTATRITRGSGAPSAGSCNAAGSVGKVYVRQDAGAANASFYSCSNTAASTYAWELFAGTGVTGPTGPTGPTGATGAAGPAPSGTGALKVTGGIAGLVSGTATDCVLVNGSSGTCGSGGGGTPGSPANTVQRNVGGSFTAQVNIFGGGSVLTSVSFGTEFANATLTQGSNLSLPAQTAAYSVTIATAVSCNTFFSGSVISITTAFTGGTGGLWGQLFHGSVAIGSLIDLTQTAGTFVPDFPGMGCVGAATNDVKFTFSGDLSHNLNGYSTGAVKVKLSGSLSE